MRSLFVELARDAGSPHPERLAQQLGVIYDGATVTAQLEHEPDIARQAKAMAAALLDADLATIKPRRAGK
jgi:hypothetical protein